MYLYSVIGKINNSISNTLNMNELYLIKWFFLQIIFIHLK